MTGTTLPWVRVAGLLVFLAPLLLLADYQDGLDAYQQGAFDRAFEEWIRVAASAPEAVHPAVRAEAQYAIGMLYWVGQGVTQDTVASANWLREAAQLNHAGAQLKLGFLFLTGDGVKKDEFEAFKWLQMAAQQGEVDAQYNLGVMYRDGLGVEPDQQRAMHWFYQAADQGDPVSAGLVADYEQRGLLLPTADSVLAAGRTGLETPPETGIDASSGVNGAAWIRARDPAHYTLQVIALLDAAKLHAFIQRYPQLQPFAIYQSTWKGSPLWVLLQGDYVTAEQAQAARDSFPTDLQPRARLWPRRFGMVQGTLPEQP